MKLKLFIATLIASALMLTLSALGAEVKYVYNTEKALDKGMTQTKYEMFLSDRRWVTAYCVKAELENKHLSLGVFNDERGISYLSTTSAIAKANDTSVAINADFFAWGQASGRGTPIGTVFFDKAMISSPAISDGMYTIIEDNDGNIFADIIDYEITITAPNGESSLIAGKNKLSDLSVPMIYDKSYDEYSLGSTETQYEAVVRDGILEEIRFQSEPLNLEDDMYVICGLSDWDTFVLDNFKIGDKVVLKENSNIDFDKIKLAAGAGAKLVSDGKALTSFSHNVSGTNPRTAFGIDKDKKTVYLVVVDGRSGSSGGMSMSELAQFMKSIGAYNAVNLDGGGSSSLVIKDKTTGAQKLTNTPSDGSERKISSVLAVSSSSKPTKQLAHITLKTENKNAYVGDGVKLSVEGFDEYYNPVTLDKIQLIYTVSGAEGRFEGDTFFPSSAGSAAIRVFTHTGLSATAEINVWDKNMPDTQNKTGTIPPSNSSLRFAVFGSVRESDTLFNNLIMKNSLSKINESADKAFFLTTKATENIKKNMTIPSQTCYPYSLYEENDSTFMLLDTEDDFMSAKEWVWVIDEAGKISTKNLFVFMQTELDFDVKRETQLLKDVLTSVAVRGVNVYLFSIGDDTKCKTENGVRYITTPGFSGDIKASGFITSREKLKYILVDIDKDGNASYRFENVY